MLVSALETHLATLQKLNFSENKIGIEGAEMLSEALPKMKALEVLNIGGNSLGDEAVNEILKSLTGLLNLKKLNISNNALGKKVTDSELVETLVGILKNSGSLTELDVSWNNLRGEAGEQLLLAFKDNFTVKKLNLSYNLFGVSSVEFPAAIIKFAEVLQDNTRLKEIDLSNNWIDTKSAFCLAHGLRVNTTLKSININGNPIGSSGIKFFLQSLNDNKKGNVEDIKMKETDLLVQPSKHQVFDPLNVEGQYELDLSNIYDRVILYHLLDIDEKIFHNSPEEEQMQQGD